MNYNLELDKEYKYKDICKILNQPVKTGRSRVLQLNNWKNYFSWINSTTQKFIITEIYDNILEIEMKTAGAAREGAGRKTKLVKEFDYIFNYFLYNSIKKNEYYRRNQYWDEVYFNNDQIYKFFGLYKDLYAGQYNEDIDQKKYELIADKIREKARSWIYNKIKKKAKDDEIFFEEGIIAYKTKPKIKGRAAKNGEYKDEWLEEWNQYQKEFIEENRLGFLKNVIDQKCWDKMIDYISDKFEGYELVKKYYKIKFKPEYIKDYNYDTYKEYRKRFNDEIIKELYDYFLNKEIKILEESENNEEYMINIMQIPKDMSINYKINEKEIMKPYVDIIDNYVKL